MISYIWPIGLVVLSNIVYQICAKGVPEAANPFASLTITYLVGAALSAVLFYVTSPQPHIVKDFLKLNWSSYLLGLVIVGLEVGYILAYKRGWPVSTASIVQSSFLAIALLFVGAVLYHETLSWTKVAGVIICLIGLVFLNWK